MVSSQSTGFAGGLIRNPDGGQIPYNFGPRMSLKSSLVESGLLQYGTYTLGQKNRRAGLRARNKFDNLLKEWPNTFEPPTAREVYWSAEANLVIASDIFEKCSGFSPSLRYHEILDLSIRLHNAGYNARFDPIVDVTHSEIDTLGKKFNLDPLKSALRIIGAIGLREYIKPPSM